MPVRDVVHYPDARLKTRCRELGAPPYDEEVQAIAHDLLDTMRSFPGCVGIAAPQIGQTVRMIAVDVTGHRKASSSHGELVLVDPVLASGEGSVVMREGCLSIPDFTGNVRRVERITVRAFTPAGGEVAIDADAYEARVLLHELDHLDGMLFLDRVDSARDVFPRKVYK